MAARIVFVYPNPRRALAAAVEAGDAPDSALLGQNHLGELGLDSTIHDSFLMRRQQGIDVVERAARILRELTLPWEVGAADVIFTPLANLLPLTARLRRRPRVVVVNYGLNTVYERGSAARRRLLARALRSAAAVVCLGEPQRLQLIDLTSVAPERVHTALLGIDADYFAPRPQPARHVLAVGKDLARDFRTFVEAVRDLDLPVEIAAYPRNLKDIRLPPHVRARRVGASELRELYAAAACVVVPQRRAGYPYGSEGGGLTTLLEAMAMARPVVLTDRPILHDYVEDGTTALVVPPEDPAALRAAIERVVESPDLASSLGEAARARVEAELTTRHFATSIAPILRAAAEPI